LTEAIAAADYVKAQREQISQSGELAERYEREAAARQLRQRQTELGRRSRLQPAILAAARYYRDQGINAGEAWEALYENPFKTIDGSVVKIEGDKVCRLKQRMRVVSPDGRQRRRSIRFDQWRQVYWTAAAKPG
jgi:hypothetical protein